MKNYRITETTTEGGKKVAKIEFRFFVMWVYPIWCTLPIYDYMRKFALNLEDCTYVSLEKAEKSLQLFFEVQRDETIVKTNVKYY